MPYSSREATDEDLFHNCPVAVASAGIGGAARVPVHADMYNDTGILLDAIWAPLNYPGLSCEEQGIAGRQYLLSTTFEEIEERCLDDMVRLLDPHGFDPAVDIEAVYINRRGHALVAAWPGFAFGRLNGIEDPPSGARKPYGQIAFAHTDLEGSPHMDAAFSQVHRAVIEIMGR